jgi:myo-inositol-1(or 4)-monophosphatase
MEKDRMTEKEVAIMAAQAAGRLIREGFGEAQLAQFKRNAIDLVTETDRQAEALIVSILQREFPEYGILSEEGSSLLGGAQESWIIDPLDGTTNYTHGYPLVAVSIALTRQDEILLGVVYNPLADELFVAEKGRGATLNDRPICVSSTSSLANSLLASGFPYDAWESDRDNTREWREFLKRVTSLRSDGSAALDLCQVACGRLDGYWELDLDPWDMAAGSLIVQEAGGRVTDVRGEPFSPYRRSIVASNGHIHRDMLEVLQRTAHD